MQQPDRRRSRCLWTCCGSRSNQRSHQGPSTTASEPALRLRPAEQRSAPQPQDVHPQAYQAPGVGAPPAPQWRAPASAGPTVRVPAPPRHIADWNRGINERRRKARLLPLTALTSATVFELLADPRMQVLIKGLAGLSLMLLALELALDLRNEVEWFWWLLGCYVCSSRPLFLPMHYSIPGVYHHRSLPASSPLVFDNYHLASMRLYLFNLLQDSLPSSSYYSSSATSRPSSLPLVFTLFNHHPKLSILEPAFLVLTVHPQLWQQDCLCLSPQRNPPTASKLLRQTGLN